MPERLIQLEQLRLAACAASSNAWSPHSGFKVGAAVADADGNVHVGCNVESDSYGLTQCAERNALSAAIVAGVHKGSMPLLVVYVPGDRALPPCGACRQVMMELLAPDARVISSCDGDHVLEWRRGELMPDAFTMD